MPPLNADPDSRLIRADAGDELTQDVLSWDTRTWAKAAVLWEDRLASWGDELDCLEVGAGPGGPALLLALKGHRVTCSNWSNTREQATPLHERYGVNDRISYEDIDVVNIPYTEKFDVIVFKSVLGGLHEHGKSSKDAMGEIYRALKPGGRLIFAENLRGTVFHRLARTIAYRVRRAQWRFTTEKEMRDLLEPFADYEMQTTGVLALFGLPRVSAAFLHVSTTRDSIESCPPPGAMSCTALLRSSNQGSGPHRGAHPTLVSCGT